ncbi:SAM-dependent methyltransferase [Saccharopolyspora elongata]|uniref:Methyltransferase domain-containing protein n=1 Tax=Saccharopolyspora elongata TaxID=2530387 RepID=A0A4R4ZE07_9PSEU|nr:methyltransferase domain-containing protein [Saccharopolyspora elongata]TDD55519.1 methyltransferase domain-containing protein [Saccharopolyspora elongata]
MTARFVPTQEDVTAFYDQSIPLISRTAGHNSHSGYWSSAQDASDLRQASDALTDALIERLPVGPADRVLDVGSGLGGPALRLAGATGAAVDGIDASSAMIAESRRRADEAGLADRVRFTQADAMAELPFPPGTFDAAWVVESFVHMADRQAAVQQIARVLKPGGRLVLTDFYERFPFTGDRLEMNEMFRRMTLNSPFPTIASLADMVRDAGLYAVEIADLSEQVSRHYPEMVKLLREKEAELAGDYGAEAIAALEAVCRNCIATGEPNYLVMTALRPAAT